MNALPPAWPALSDAGARSLQLDQLQLGLRRSSGEYWVEHAYRNEGSNEARNAGGTETVDATAPASHRYLLGMDAGPIAVEPLLADRAVVSRPQVATELLPRERVTLLVSTVLWVRLAVGDRPLMELPVIRLSDTWFGPDTRHGELCYAARTRARLALVDVENPLRAITPITIINRGSDALKLERINVPVTNLTLYADGRQFWTSPITVAREGDIAPAKVQIDARPPPHSPQAVPVAAPRRPLRDGVFDKAVNLLFA